MKKAIYRELSAFLFRLNKQLQHFQPSESRAKQLLESKANTCQVQALMLYHFANLDEQAFRKWPAFSWMGKDGIDGWLLYLLARGGMGDRTCVDFGAATGADGNTFNLVMNHGFTGYMIDGNENALQFGRQIYKTMRLAEPTFIPTMLNRENVAMVCSQNQLPPSPEVLSLDIDSIDWYVLEALPLKPSIIVLEFNNLWGPDESFTIPYDPAFQRELNAFMYGGASLKAFYDLLIPKGYKLVAVAASGFDAIFVQDNNRFSFIGSISPENGFVGSPVWQQQYKAGLYHEIRKKPWVSKV